MPTQTRSIRKPQKEKKHTAAAALLCLVALAALAACAVFAWAVVSGSWPASKSAVAAQPPRVLVLDQRFCTNLANCGTTQEMTAMLDEALADAVTLAGEGQSALALAGRTAKGSAIFRDGTDTLTTAANITATDSLFSRFDPVQYLVRQAAAQGVPVYWLATDDAGNALTADQLGSLPAWETALAEKHGLTVLAPQPGADDTLTSYASADGSLTLLRSDALPALLAAALQTGDGTAGLVLGDHSDLSADSTSLTLLNRYLSGDTLPDLTQCWNGKTLNQTLSVSYPASSGATVYSSSLFVMGTSDPAQPLTLNGETVPRYGTAGVWGVLITLEKGENTLTLQNGADSLAYTVTYGSAGGGSASTPTADGTPGAEAIGQKVQITDAIASALGNYGDSSSIHDTLYQGATAEIVDVATYTSGGKITHAYRLATGDYVRAATCQVVDAPDAAFTGCTVAEDAASNCTVLTFTGSGTPAVYHSWQGDTLQLEFLSASYSGTPPQSERFSAQVQATGTGGFQLSLAFSADDPLYGWAVNYDAAANTTTLWLKHTPHLSGDPSAPLAGVTVMLDPGHGGSDDGAMGAAGSACPVEKELNLSAATAARYRLEQLGATVVMTREDDSFPTLGDRVTALNEQHPDLFISIHHNSLELTNDINQSGGTEAYWFYQQGESLADALIDNVCAVTGRSDRGSAYGYYYVTRSNICPATLLELGFVTNPAEYEQCADVSAQWAEGGAIAQAVYQSIAANS